MDNIHIGPPCRHLKHGWMTMNTPPMRTCWTCYFEGGVASLVHDAADIGNLPLIAWPGRSKMPAQLLPRQIQPSSKRPHSAATVNECRRMMHLMVLHNTLPLSEIDMKDRSCRSQGSHGTEDGTRSPFLLDDTRHRTPKNRPHAHDSKTTGWRRNGLGADERCGGMLPQSCNPSSRPPRSRHRFRALERKQTASHLDSWHVVGQLIVGDWLHKFVAKELTASNSPPAQARRSRVWHRHRLSHRWSNRGCSCRTPLECNHRLQNTCKWVACSVPSESVEQLGFPWGYRVWAPYSPYAALLATSNLPSIASASMKRHPRCGQPISLLLPSIRQ